MLRAILFDLDGTLLDSLPDIASALNAALTECGFPTHAQPAYRLMVGEGRRVLVERALPVPQRADEETILRVMAGFDREYARRWPLNTRPYPGVVDLLDQLARRGLPLAILSNKPDEFVQEMVRETLPARHFTLVGGQSPAWPRKPDPAQAVDMARRLAVACPEMAFVGDSGVDMRTARGAGMLPVGVRWGLRDAPELLEQGAQHLLETPADLLRLLG